LATYRDRGRFVDHHNVLIHVYNGDGLASDGHFMSATLQAQYLSWYGKLLSNTKKNNKQAK
jgi:hypothetical protein